ncbi:methyltransferase [Streptomyces cyanogenus]|uniref:Multifunctional cyclase-dehydratase-3-O-methyl transferase TcmN n=1 Tax=Streptomyces cyanogenus TaxID=80860 RepID=A0ABX7TTM4_STRCY|nr:methyltransferase [Streptomyces cyanogenus]QTE00106.1 Multifunctional cyclase-dehydratase-3-O-methyl transferase TcmN [Streptomyces cyanogenus]
MTLEASAPIGLPGGPYDPPHARLLALAAAKWAAQPIAVLAEMGIADALADGPRTLADLAAAVEAQPSALRRCLRAAACVGVFAEQEDGRWSLTPMADCLRRDAATPIRNWVLMLTRGPMWDSFGKLAETVRTGRSAFEVAHGTPLFDYLDKDDAFREVYESAMGELTGELAAELADVVDFGRYGTLVDLGGGDGALLGNLLARYPDCRGVLVERPRVIELARPRLTALGVADRVRLVPGDATAEVPAGGDAYLVKNMLHCFDDDTALAVLRRVRAAGGADATLFVVEAVVPPGNDFHWAKLIDIEMLADNDGRERTEEEWRELLHAAGFALDRVCATTPPQSVLIARPLPG